jgi:hypothetical protein
MEHELPRMKLAPYADAYNLFNSGLSGEQNRGMSTLQPSFQGSQASDAAALQRYQFDTQNYNNKFTYDRQNKKGGGFFSKLFAF